MDLAHLGLGEQDQVGGHRADRRPRAPEHPRQLGDAAALGVPRQQRVLEVQPAGQGRTDGTAAAGEGRERAHGSPQLHGGAQAAQRGDGLVEPARPAGGAEPDGDRRRLLQQRPSRGRAVAVLPGECGRGVGRHDEVVRDHSEGTAGDEDARRVHDVLAGRTAVHGGGGAVAHVRPDGLAQRGDQRDDRIARGGRVERDRGHVEPLGPAGRGDRLRRPGPEPAGVGGRAREGGLDLQQGCEPRGVADGLTGPAAREDLVEEADGAPRVGRGHRRIMPRPPTRSTRAFPLRRTP